MAVLQSYDPSTLGQPASADWPSSFIFGAQAPPVAGSSLGVPPTNAIAGQTDTGSSASAVEYGKRKQLDPAHKQPILWLVVLVVVGVFFLSHAARLSVREG